jgi:hypothetical protein
MSLPSQYTVCPYCNYVGGIQESECPRPRCSGGSIARLDFARFPTLLWVVRHRAGEVVFFPPQSFGRDRGSSKKAQAGARAFLRVGVKGEGTVEIIKSDKSESLARRLAGGGPQQYYQGAVKECIGEFETVITAMHSIVATLRRLQDLDLPAEVYQVAETEVRALTARVANGLTRGAQSVTRTLPAAMLAAERTIIQAAEGGAPVTKGE